MDHEQALATITRLAPDLDVPGMIDGSAADLADRLILLDHVLGILGDVRRQVAEDLTNLADEWPLERPGGTVTYEAPTGGYALTNRDALVRDLRLRVADDLATDIATGEVNTATRRIAMTAIERFVAMGRLEPRWTDVGNLLGSDALPNYREWRVPSGAGKVKVLP